MPQRVYSQQHEIDSLRNILRTSKDDTSKIEILNALAWQVTSTGDYHSADSLADRALQLSEKLNFKKGITMAWYDIGSNFYYQSNFRKAAEAYNKAAEIAKEINNKNCLAKALNGIGVVYEQQGNYSQALDMYSKVLDIYIEIKSNSGISIAYGNMANVYEEQGKASQALEYHLKALQMAEEIGDKQGIAYECGNIGKLYKEQHNYAQSLKYNLKGLQIVKEIGDKDAMTTILINLANVYAEQEESTQALDYFNQALVISENIGDKQGIAIELDNIGRIYSDKGDYTKALQYGNRGLKIREEIGDKEGIANSTCGIGNTLLKQKKYRGALDYEGRSLAVAKEAGALTCVSNAEKSLSEIYEQMGNGIKALEYYKAYTTVQDTLFSKENAKKTVQAEMNYEFDKKQAAEKAEQDQKDAIHKNEVKKQKIIIYSVTIGFLLVLLLAITIFRSLQQNRKKTLIITRQKEEVERQKTIVEQQKIIVEEQKFIVEEKNKEVRESITYAKRLQDAILPPLTMITQSLPESFVLYKPKDIVAGDFYWMEHNDDQVFIAAADSTGHGVPGAMVSVVCSNALNRAVKEFNITEPGKILDKVRDLVLETFAKNQKGDIKDGMDISLIAISQQPLVNGSVEAYWSGANNPLWYIVNGEIKEISADKQPVGMQDNPKPFKTHKLVLNKGDMIYLFTDGYADQFGGPKGKKYKYKPFQDLLKSSSLRSMEECKGKLDNVFEEWKGTLEQTDDVCVIGIRV